MQRDFLTKHAARQLRIQDIYYRKVHVPTNIIEYKTYYRKGYVPTNIILTRHPERLLPQWEHKRRKNSETSKLN
jgi:hypothetical protein